MSKEQMEEARIKGMVFSIFLHGLALILLATMTYKVASKEGGLLPGTVEITTTSAVASAPPEITPAEVTPKKVEIEKPVKSPAKTAKVAKVAKAPKAPKDSVAAVVPVKLPTKKAEPVKAAKAKAVPVVVPEVTDDESPIETAKDESVVAEPTPSPEPKKAAVVPVPVVNEEEGLEDGDSAEELASEELDEEPLPTKAVAQKPASKPSAPAAAGGGMGRATGPGVNAGKGVGLSPYADGVRSDKELIPLPGNPPGSYPPQARINRVQGAAIVDFDVDPQGRVSRVRIKKSSGSAELDQEALSTQRQWRYRGGKIGTFRKEFVFRLKGDAQEAAYKIR